MQVEGADAQVQRASKASRLPISEIRHSVLGRWADHLYRTQPHSTPSRSGPSWTWTGTANSCTHCQAEETSRLEWRLPWILTCDIHHCYLGAPDQPAPNPNTHVLTAYILDLSKAGTASRKTLETIEIWRDAITLAHALGRSPAHGRQDLQPAHHRARLLHALIPLTMATDAEERAGTLYSWCVDAGLTRPTKSTSPTLHGRTLKDAIDCASPPCGGSPGGGFSQPATAVDTSLTPAGAEHRPSTPAPQPTLCRSRRVPTRNTLPAPDNRRTRQGPRRRPPLQTRSSSTQRVSLRPPSTSGERRHSYSHQGARTPAHGCDAFASAQPKEPSPCDFWPDLSSCR